MSFAAAALASIALFSCNGGHVNGTAGLTYTLSDDSSYYTLTDVTGVSDATITVGNWHEGKPVTTIGEAALKAADATLKTLVVSEGITTLSFRWCRNTGVQKVTLPNGIAELPTGSFIRAISLTEVTFGTGLTKFNDGALTTDIGVCGIKTINFRGTEAQWKAISVGTEDSGYLAKITVNYNFKG